MMGQFLKLLSALLLTGTMVIAQRPHVKSYEPAEGKTVGIWPHNDRFSSVERMRELKERWGFEYVLLAAIYGRNEMTHLKRAGYDSLHTAFQVYLPDLIEKKQSYLSQVREIGKIWGYYFDEPISREHSYKEFLNLLSLLSDEGLYPHAQFIVSELDEKKARTILPFVDQLTYSGYGNSEDLGSDQVKTWGEWKNYLGSKFGMLWISADLDSNEYRTLFKAARELDFNSVWLYALEPLQTGREVSDSNYEKFCEAAVEFGFMKIRKNN